MLLRKLVAVALILAVPIGLCVVYRPDRAIQTGTSAVADAVCVKTFVSGLDPQAVHAETLARPGLRDLRRVMRYPVDRATNTVDVSVLGLMASHAVFRDGVGCVLRHGSQAPYQLRSDIDAPKEPKTPPLLPEIAGPDLVEPADPALKAAAVSCLRGTDAPPYRRTEAVVIVHAPASGATAARLNMPRAAADRDPPRRVLRIRQSRPALRDHPVAARGRGSHGRAVDPTGDIRGLGRLVKEVIAATGK